MERQATQVADNFRHELGHVLSEPELVSEWEPMYNKHGRDWFAEHVSFFAVKDNDPLQALAETFALATDPAYERGTLPRDIEEIVFARVLGEGG